MDAIEASAPLYVPCEEVYEFIRTYEGVSDHSDHLERVEQDGDGGPGTEYDITLSWWRLSWTARSRVTEVDPPNRIAWRTTDDVRAKGWWLMDPLPDGRVPQNREHGTELRLRIEFDPVSMRGHSVTRVLPLDRLVQRVTPVVVRECEALLSGVADDLEGEPRSVDYEVHRRPSSLPV